MRGTAWTAFAVAIAAMALLSLPSATAEPAPGHVWVTSGIPVKFAGNVSATAGDAVLVLRSGGQFLTLEADDATLRQVEIITHYALLPDGTRAPVEQVRSDTAVAFDGVLGFSDDARLAAQADRVAVAAGGADVEPEAAWSQAKTQLTTQLTDERVEADVPAMPTDVQEAPVDGVDVARATPMLRTADATVEAGVHHLLFVSGSATDGTTTYVAGQSESVEPGGLWTPGGQWTGPGNHIETTVTYLILEAADARLRGGVAGGVLDVAANDLRLDSDGLVALPWAKGVVTTPEGTQTLSGEQVLLGGDLTWTPVGASVTKAPQLRLAAQGVLDYVHVGGLDVGLTDTEKAAVGVGAVATAGAAAAVVWYWPLIKFAVSGFFAGLYARVPKDKVLEHDGRERVYELIKNEPGVATNNLADKVEFGWSTLTYHLRVLERTEMIVSVRDGRHKRFFDRTSGRYANGRKHLVSVLKNESTRDIATYILREPGTTQKEVGEAFGLAPSSVHWHVERLTEAELVTKLRDKHRVRYHPGPGWESIDPNDVGLEEDLVASADAVEAPAARVAAKA